MSETATTVLANSLFRRMTWAEYKRQDSSTQINVDQQVTYITDKNLYVHTKKISDIGAITPKYIDIIYSGSYGFGTKVSKEDLVAIQNQLIAGIYITETTQGTGAEAKTTNVIYYFDGDTVWIEIAASSALVSMVKTVNGQGPVNGNVVITARDIGATITPATSITIQAWLDQLQENTIKKSDTHQWFDGKTPDGAISTYTDFNKGNIQIDGYFEGKVDGGGW